VALLAFIKNLIAADWDQTLADFMQELLYSYSCLKSHLADLQTQMHFSGVWHIFNASETPVFGEDARLPSLYKNTKGMLTYSQHPPVFVCIVLSVPRQRLQPIYDKSFKDMKKVKCVFACKCFPRLFRFLES
jgi:hypothetical protein